MTKDRRLGRGLAALLGEPLDEPSRGVDERTSTATPAGDGGASGGAPGIPMAARMNDGGAESQAQSTMTDVMHLNVYEIDDNPFQPRRDFSEPEIASLAESLKQHDMLQPILVRRVGDRYQLISGERRLRAAIRAGWSSVPARLREADDRLVAELAIVENLQRKDLNPIEKAMSFKRYLDQHQCTQDDLAQRLKIDRSTIANLMRLLELPESVLEAVRSGAISAGHARALLPLGDDSEQADFCNRIRREGLSVRDTERLVQERIEEAEGDLLDFAGRVKGKRKRTQSDQVVSLEQELRMALGTKVEIRQASRDRGRIIVHFSSHDEFDRLRDLLTGTGPGEQRDAA